MKALPNVFPVRELTLNLSAFLMHLLDSGTLVKGIGDAFLSLRTEQLPAKNKIFIIFYKLHVPYISVGGRVGYLLEKTV